MITEEALPSYSVSLNLLAGDTSGTSDDPWARWLRGWTSEENRHGDVLNAYLRLTGRVDMRAVEVTVHHLLNNGFSPRAYPDPYAGLVYTAFQERATKISHANVARRAASQGEGILNQICLKIAGDEARHEAFYTRMMSRVMDEDPEGGILTFRAMMRRVIVMPGKLMFDGKDPDLFDHFATVAQRAGIYTVRDYAAITDHLLNTWRVADRSVRQRRSRPRISLQAAAAIRSDRRQSREKHGNPAALPVHLDLRTRDMNEYLNRCVRPVEIGHRRARIQTPGQERDRAAHAIRSRRKAPPATLQAARRIPRSCRPLKGGLPYRKKSTKVD